MPAALSTGHLDQSVRSKIKKTERTLSADRSFVVALMGCARTWFPQKPAVELGEIIERPARTADRYFTGERLPDAVACIRIMRSHVAPQFIGAVVRGLPLEQRTAIARATLTADGL